MPRATGGVQAQFTSSITLAPRRGGLGGEHRVPG